MENTWASRDLPVLNAMVQYLDDAAGAMIPELRDIAEITGLEVIEVGKAALALESDGLVELGKTAGGHGTWSVRRVAAKRAGWSVSGPAPNSSSTRWPSASGPRLTRSQTPSAVAAP